MPCPFSPHTLRDARSPNVGNETNARQIEGAAVARDKGYNIKERSGPRGTSYTVEIWDARAGRYGLRRTFAQRKHSGRKDVAFRAAKEYGRDQAAAVRAEVKAVQLQSGCPTRAALDLFLDDLARRQCNPTYMANIRRRLRDLHRYCPDLAGRDAPRQCYTWWSAWCDEPAQIGNRKGVKGKTTTGKPKGITTRNDGLANLKAFCAWCYRARALTGLPHALDVDWIQALKAEHKVKPIFTLDELGRCLRMAGDPYRIRFAFGLYLGARFSEMKQARWDDLQGGFHLLRGKGRKERLAPMQAEVATLLRLHRRSGEHGGEWVMPEHVRRMDSGNNAKRFDAFLRRAGVAKAGRTFHSLRHCYAGLMTATGETTSLLQQYMGHSESDMTMHYSQLALRYREEVDGWPRGRLPVLRSAAQG